MNLSESNNLIDGSFESQNGSRVKEEGKLGADALAPSTNEHIDLSTSTLASAGSSTMQSPKKLLTYSNDTLINIFGPKLQEAWQNIVSRLRTESTVFTHFTDLKLDQAIEHGFDQKLLPISTEFASNAEIMPSNFRAGYKANYNFKTREVQRRIYIRAAAPTVEQMLSSLLQNGTLGDVVCSLVHETTHATQVPHAGGCSYKVLLSDILNTIKARVLDKLPTNIARSLDKESAGHMKVLLNEIHAHESTTLIGGHTRPNRYQESSFDAETRKNFVLRRCCQAYTPEFMRDKFKRNDDRSNAEWLADYGSIPLVRSLSRAYDQIHVLRLLGIDDNKIGALIATCLYDKKSGSFPQLAKFLAAERTRQGFEDDLSFEAVIKQRELDESERLTSDNSKARKIAREEIRKAILSIN